MVVSLTQNYYMYYQPVASYSNKDPPSNNDKSVRSLISLAFIALAITQIKFYVVGLIPQ